MHDDGEGVEEWGEKQGESDHSAQGEMWVDKEMW